MKGSTFEGFIILITIVLMIAIPYFLVEWAISERAKEAEQQRQEHVGCKVGHKVYSCRGGNQLVETFYCDEKYPEVAP